ncbi:MAG: dihydropteroate synthase [Denitrovibrio sp.]|nr:MAG: dihydropteroate synthase [Denitrovibrio sp.]
MGILNITPDSFSDGGVYNNIDGMISRVEEFLLHGVDITDIGGESTRPGSEFIDADTELMRVLPALKLAAESGLFVSVDTNKPVVAEAALENCAGMINDVTGMKDEKMRKICAEHGCAVCIMHMFGEPKSMQNNPIYIDVVEDVRKFLFDAAEKCIKDGIKENAICIDPGFGFGKSLEDNYRLLASLHRLKEGGFPVLAGLSRKSMIGGAVNRPPAERLAGTLTAETIALMNGADIIRAHDIAETVDMINVYQIARGLANA